jgi:hypothetical protein
LRINTKETGFLLTSCSKVNWGFLVGWGRVFFTCLLRLKLLVNPPLQAIANDAQSQFLSILKVAIEDFCKKPGFCLSPIDEKITTTNKK